MNERPQRARLLRSLARKRNLHRYDRWRIAIGLAATVGIAALPLTGTLRLDLWGGRHMVLGEELGFAEALKAFAFPFLAINVGIILLTRLAGRYLCGFACPVGNLARLGEWTQRAHGPEEHPRIRAFGLLGLCALLAGITLSFWVDLRVFVEGSALARSISAGALFGLTGVLFLGARRLGMGFCRELCPSGIYFALLGPESKTGIEYAHPEHCTDCGVCDQVCPVDLAPRQLLEGIHEPGRGLYPEGLTSLGLCLRCGDCVRGCEGVNAKKDQELPLRLGILSEQTEREAQSA